MDASERRPQQRYPAVVHVAALTCFIAPIACIPYLLSRRQIHRLRREVEELATANRILQRESQFIRNTLRGLSERTNAVETRVTKHDPQQVVAVIEARIKKMEESVAVCEMVNDTFKDDLQHTRLAHTLLFLI
jgi:regulator of replication initiation timing